MGEYKRHREMLLLALIGFLCLVVIAEFVLLLSFSHKLERLDQAFPVKGVNNTREYTLLDDSIATMSAQDFLVQQRASHLDSEALRDDWRDVLADAQGSYAVYFEDLNTGQWVGVNERDEFKPKSTFKVAVMIATLKKIELGELSFNKTLTITKDDLTRDSFIFSEVDIGHNFTVAEYLSFMIRNSDNVALSVLWRQLDNDDLAVANPSVRLKLELNPTANFTISPKEYANILRSLYFSTNMRRPFSQYALELLATTDFNSQIPAGVPSTITVSHKIGIDAPTGQFHDCGIVYNPGRAYILCVMSRDSTQEEADAMISGLSRATYERVRTD